ncbi:hypothetical protein HDE_04771 [Halotydeus destructor]|nr:hypothetical protein HDE_04771 [Halotydeus destructor]
MVTTVILYASNCEARSVDGSKVRPARSLNLPDDYDSFNGRFYPLLNELKMQDKRTAMGVDLPDYILHYNGKGMSPNLGNYRAKMERNG